MFRARGDCLLLRAKCEPCKKRPRSPRHYAQLVYSLKNSPSKSDITLEVIFVIAEWDSNQDAIRSSRDNLEYDSLWMELSLFVPGVHIGLERFRYLTDDFRQEFDEIPRQVSFYEPEVRPILEYHFSEGICRVITITSGQAEVHYA